MTVPEIKAKLNKANVGTTIDKTTTEIINRMIQLIKQMMK